nr:uncharacterized protein LOC112740486 [Arachis hypogaea]
MPISRIRFHRDFVLEVQFLPLQSINQVFGLNLRVLMTKEWALFQQNGLVIICVKLANFFLQRKLYATGSLPSIIFSADTIIFCHICLIVNFMKHQINYIQRTPIQSNIKN